MEARTDEGEAGTKTRGRKDSEGQEAVIKRDVMEKKLANLVELKKKADDASEAFNDAIKATAEKSGLLASVVRKYVTARAGDKFEDEKTKVGQLAIAFGVED